MLCILYSLIDVDFYLRLLICHNIFMWWRLISRISGVEGMLLTDVFCDRNHGYMGRHREYTSRYHKYCLLITTVSMHTVLQLISVLEVLEYSPTLPLKLSADVCSVVLFPVCSHGCITFSKSCVHLLVAAVASRVASRVCIACSMSRVLLFSSRISFLCNK